MSDFRIDKITNRDGSAGTQICGVSTFSGTTGMVMPGGPTEYRGGRGRGVYTGGTSPDTLQGVNSMSYIEIATTGNAMDFGDLTAARNDAQAVSNATRGLFGGGGQDAPANDQTNLIDYITIATLGNAKEFGDLSYARQSHSACSSPTRGVWTNGYRYSPAGHVADMDYVQIATTGNAVDFGDSTSAQGNVANSNGRGGL